MAILPKEFVLNRLTELSYDDEAFWQAASVPAEHAVTMLESHKTEIASVRKVVLREDRIEVEIDYCDGKTHVLRLIGVEARRFRAL